VAADSRRVYPSFSPLSPSFSLSFLEGSARRPTSKQCRAVSNPRLGHPHLPPPLPLFFLGISLRSFVMGLVPHAKEPEVRRAQTTLAILFLFLPFLFFCDSDVSAAKSSESVWNRR